MRGVYIVIFFFILSFSQSYAQVETQYYQEGDTISFFQNVLFQRQNGITIKMPAFDLEKIRKEDAEMEGHDVPYRFGKGFDVFYTLSDGLWQDVDSGRVWTMSFESEGAISLNYIFENMYLPEGASLFIVNHNKTVVYGPVTSEVLVPKKSSFLSDIIPGASSTILLFEPTEKCNESTLTIKRVVHGYRGFDFKKTNKSQEESNYCNINVACYPDYENESKGVALVLLSNGEYLCSGSLLMSTNLSFTPYFLTAFHCLDYDDNNALSDSEKQDVENWMFKFCFKKTTCNGSLLASSYTYNYASFCSAWHGSDFALLRLSSSVSQNSNLTWLGWDRSNGIPSSGVGIHHPKGDVMKISIEEDQFGITSTYLGNFGWVVNFDDGIEESGSSGSPIFNQNKHVVGQLYGGPKYADPCLQTEAHYGKLFCSWTGAGSNDSRLYDWLDPIGTCQTTIDSNHPISISGSTIPCGNSVYSINNLPSGYTVGWSWQNSNNPGLSSDPPLQQNTPSTNMCTISNSSQLHIHNILVAYIYRNRLFVNTLEKEINTGSGFSTNITGTYNGLLPDGMLPPPDISSTTICDNDTLNTTGGYELTMTSNAFNTHTVSYTGSAVNNWINYGNGTIFVKLKNINSSSYVTVYGTNGCQHFQYRIYVKKNMVPFLRDESVSISTTDKLCTVNLDIDAVDVSGNRIDSEEISNSSLQWHYSVVNVLTGNTILENDAEGTTTTFDLSKYPSGVYVIKVEMDDQTVSKKISI